MSSMESKLKVLLGEKPKFKFREPLLKLYKLPIDHVKRQDFYCPLTPYHNCIGGRCIQFCVVKLGEYGICRWQLSTVENLRMLLKGDEKSGDEPYLERREREDMLDEMGDEK